MGIAIVWEDPSGGYRAARAPARVYVGRHPSPPPSESPLDVYVMRYEGLGIEASMGGPYPAVSRLHALIEASSGWIRVVDHGPRGAGSRNGTHVDGAVIRGGYRIVRRPWVAVGLAMSGPRFLVMTGDEISIPAGAPLDLPPTLSRLARELGPGDEVEIDAGGLPVRLVGRRAPVGVVDCMVALRIEGIIKGALMSRDPGEAGRGLSELSRLLEEFRGSTERVLAGGIDDLVYAVVMARGGDLEGAMAILERVLPRVSSYASGCMSMISHSGWDIGGSTARDKHGPP